MQAPCFSLPFGSPPLWGGNLAWLVQGGEGLVRRKVYLRNRVAITGEEGHRGYRMRLEEASRASCHSIQHVFQLRMDAVRR